MGFEPLRRHAVGGGITKGPGLGKANRVAARRRMRQEIQWKPRGESGECFGSNLGLQRALSEGACRDRRDHKVASVRATISACWGCKQ